MADSLTDLRVGRVVKIDGEPYAITWNNFMKTAQRKPVMRTKLRSVISGKSLDKTFTSGESFELAHIEKVTMQFLYKDVKGAYFMDNESFEQVELSLELLGDAIGFLKEGENTVVTKFEGNPIGIEVPVKVALKVVETSPGVRGDTAQGGTKPAKLETGISVQVPLFINEGDTIRVNTETMEYTERAQ